MPQFRKKPVIITAEQYQGIGGEKIKGVCVGGPDCETPELRDRLVYKAHLHTMHKGQSVILADGDWVIPEPDGIHFYPCKPDVFKATYDPVDSKKTTSQSETKPQGEKTMDDPTQTKTVSKEDEQADFEKIAGFCSTFRDNYGMVNDGEMTTEEAAQRGSVLIGQILDVAIQHEGHKYFDRIRELSIAADSSNPTALQQVLELAESKGSLPGGISGHTDLEGQGDMEGSGTKGGVG